MALARRKRLETGATWGICENGASGPTFAYDDIDAGFSAIFVSGPIGLVLLSVAVLIRAVRGDPVSRHLALAVFLLMASYTLSVLTESGVLPRIALSPYYIPMGTVAQWFHEVPSTGYSPKGSTMTKAVRKRDVCADTGARACEQPRRLRRHAAGPHSAHCGGRGL